jgi:hypothetical protein
LNECGCSAETKQAPGLSYRLLADFSNRLHVLLLLSTVAVYSILALDRVALGAHVSGCTERILKAIEVPPAAERSREPVAD